MKKNDYYCSSKIKPQHYFMVSNYVKCDYFFSKAGYWTKDTTLDSKTDGKDNFPICIANGKLYHRWQGKYNSEDPTPACGVTDLQNYT